MTCLLIVPMSESAHAKCTGNFINPIPRIGIAAGFWEPIRLVDVTKQPFCFPTLAGMEMDLGLNLGRGSSPHSSDSGNAFWHVHWYNSQVDCAPKLEMLGNLLKFHCEVYN